MNNNLKNIFELLELERASIFELLQKVPAEFLQQCPDENSWSVIQIIDHMLQVERASLTYLKKKIKAGADVPEASFSSKIRTFLLISFLHSPMKFKAPESLKTPVNDKELGEMLHIWNAVRKDLIKFLEVFPEDLLGKAIFKHPVSGRIKMDQTLQFFRAHQAHHLHQIQRTLKKING
ncbi:MAG: DinB family protein [Cyclobacteriaceae bacterium]